MTADEVKRWLYDGKDGKPDEVGEYDRLFEQREIALSVGAIDGYVEDEIAILESLAAGRKMLVLLKDNLEEQGYEIEHIIGEQEWIALASLIAGLPREGGEDGKIN